MTSTAPGIPANLPLRRRPIDIFFAIMFTIFIVTSCIADMLPTLGVDFNQPNGTFPRRLLLLTRMRKPLPFTRRF